MTPLLVTNLIHIRYLSGVEMTFGIMLVTSNKKVLFADPRYMEKAKAEIKRGVQIIPFDEIWDHVQKYKRIRFEADEVTVAQLDRWKKRIRGTKLIPSSGVIEEIRRVKNKSELSKIQKAAEISDAVMRKIPELLTVGVTEKEVAWQIEKTARELGADAMSFASIVGFSDHSARPHHAPTNKRLKKRDIVQIDMGVKIDGYCSDCSRVFFKGKPTDEQKKIFDLLVKTLKKTARQVKAGVTNQKLDAYARKIIGTYDKYFPHSLGHGVGLDLHEEPRISKRAQKQILKPGEVCTIEPGIYFPGKWGMRVEDMVLVTKSGSKVLTRAKM